MCLICEVLHLFIFLQIKIKQNTIVYHIKEKNYSISVLCVNENLDWLRNIYRTNLFEENKNSVEENNKKAGCTLHSEDI